MRRLWCLVFAVVAVLVLAPPPIQAQQGTITIKAWTIGPDPVSTTRLSNLQTAAERLNADLKRAGANYQIKVDGSYDTTNWDQYLRRVLLVFQSGDAPDIVQASAALSTTWAAGGFLAPLDEYIPKYTQFGDIVPSLWTSVKYKGKTWGIPQDTEARPFFFNKVLLKKLGWSDQQIADLPKRISSGDFTWDDVLALAKEALQKNVIEPGKGYYHRPFDGPDFMEWYRAFGGRDDDSKTGKLVFTKAAALRYYRWLRAGTDAGVIEKDRINSDWNRFHGPITDGDGKVLFWSGGTWNWPDWAQNWVSTRGGETWLMAHVGYAPQPSYVKGGRPVTLSNPQAYMVSAASKNKDLAVRLLAYTTVPDLDAKHAVFSGHLPVLKRTAALISDPYIKSVSYLLNYTTFQPGHPDLPKWQGAFFRGVSAVESGSATPEQAVDVVAGEMQRTLGDQVIIE